MSHAYNIAMKILMILFILIATRVCSAENAKISKSQDGEKSMQSKAEEFSKRCSAGEAEACTEMGNAHRAGQHVPHSETKAVEFYLKGCNLQGGASCANLGYSYESGRGIEKSPSKAFESYKRGCDVHHEYSCWKVGDCYARGIGVEKSESMADQIFKKICDSGDVLACTSLSPSFRDKGPCDPLSEAKAAALFAYATCGEKRASCSSFSDLKGKPVLLDIKSKVPMLILWSKVIYDPSTKSSSIRLLLDSKSRCWFGEATAKLIGKTAAIVADGKVISSPSVSEAMGNGKVLLTMPREISHEETAALCRAISQTCIVSDNEK
jgi:hypothetical protein